MGNQSKSRQMVKWTMNLCFSHTCSFSSTPLQGLVYLGVAKTIVGVSLESFILCHFVIATSAAPTNYQYYEDKYYAPPQRSNSRACRRKSDICCRQNGGKLKRKITFNKSKAKAVTGKRSFTEHWESVEKFPFVYLWLYRLVFCSVTVFLAILSYFAP